MKAKGIEGKEEGKGLPPKKNKTAKKLSWEEERSERKNPYKKPAARETERKREKR